MYLCTYAHEYYVHVNMHVYNIHVHVNEIHICTCALTPMSIMYM